jgi:hypothetical protein
VYLRISLLDIGSCPFSFPICLSLRTVFTGFVSPLVEILVLPFE